MIPAWAKRLHAPMGFHVGGVDRRFQKMLEGRGPVLNVGAKHTAGAGWINMDIVRHAPSIHVLGDARRLPFRSGSMAGVVMKFVLEHVPEPDDVVREVHRVLAPGGVFLAAVPFVEPFHADPGDFQRYTLDGFKKLCGSFDVIESGAYFGPAAALVEVLREFCAAFFDASIPKKIVRLLAGWFFLPLKYIDAYLLRKKHAHQCAYCVYLIVRKPWTDRTLQPSVASSEAANHRGATA